MVINVRLIMNILAIILACLVVLKVTNNVDWSWWIILLPLLVPTILVAIVGIILVALFFTGKDEEEFKW